MHINDLINKDMDDLEKVNDIINKNCKQTIEIITDIIDIVKNNPNNMDLGYEVRNYIHNMGKNE